VHLVVRHRDDVVGSQCFDARVALEQRLACPALRRTAERLVVAAVAEVPAHGLLVAKRAMAEATGPHGEPRRYVPT